MDVDMLPPFKIVYWSPNLHVPATDQVPIHTVTLDVQDHDKTQHLPAELPKDFQEVKTVFFMRSDTLAVS